MKKILLLLVFVSVCTGSFAQQFDYDKIAPHPRLLLPKGEEESIKQTMAAYSPLATVHQRIMQHCNEILTEQPVERIKEGKRLLAVSRIALKRIFYLSYAYRMAGDEKFAHRAEVEMLAVSRFEDWNPTHFLDVGEMVMALAIGYDWLYDYLRPETRRLVCEAIVEKGFDAAKNTRNAWFYTARNNWNSVCNSGLTYGALALFEEIPEVSKGIIEKCMETNPKAMVGYGPDGGYPEGFGYWGYGTSFQVMLIAALESALGTDNGLSQAPGFMESARFMQFMTAPGGDCFCFSDSPVEAECNMMMFWFAAKAKDLSLLWIERQYLNRPDMAFAEDRLLPSLMVFCSQLDMKNIRRPAKNFWFNRGDTPVFIYRSGWDSQKDTYLGVKGGSPSTSHAHMDAGSFIFERDGVRWAMDLGMQSYITLESKGVDLWNMSQSGQRWDVFRLSNKAHSTLTINGERHLVKSYAPITRTFQTKKQKGAEVDLSSVFANSVDKAVRTVTLDKKENLEVIDRIETGNKEATVSWIMVTPAEAKIVGQNRIELTKDGRQMLLVADADTNVEMKIWSNVPPHEYDFQNPGTIRVGFETTIPANRAMQLSVQLIPLK
ncbi:MAG: heparinase II/III family protein [Bacteroides xylanisolvens]|nr:heparinase II/III family protein [Bacteroides reticulotermitis]